MFEGCINLSKVVLPVNLVGVGTRAFKKILTVSIKLQFLKASSPISFTPSGITTFFSLPPL